MYPLPRACYEVFLYAQRTGRSPASVGFDPVDADLWREMADVALMGVRGGLRFLPSYGLKVRFVRVRSETLGADPEFDGRDVVSDEEYWGEEKVVVVVVDEEGEDEEEDEDSDSDATIRPYRRRL